MDEWLQTYAPLVFFAVVLVAWLLGGILTGVSSGWYRLMKCYPDQIDEPLLELVGRTGLMGGKMSLRCVLNLSLCARGLRIGMSWWFSLFCRPFFVPWADIHVTRRRMWGVNWAELHFGAPSLGRLRIEASLADRLARNADAAWPEAGPFPEERVVVSARWYLLTWAVYTVGFTAFFSLAPWLLEHDQSPPPILFEFLASAILVGIGIFNQYRRER